MTFSFNKYEPLPPIGSHGTKSIAEEPKSIAAKPKSIAEGGKGVSHSDILNRFKTPNAGEYKKVTEYKEGEVYINLGQSEKVVFKKVGGMFFITYDGEKVIFEKTAPEGTFFKVVSGRA